LAAGIAATLQEPAIAPVSLPHLSAKVLADEYADLYRGLISSANPVKKAASTDSIELTAAERQSL
jgi:hypothetical protein